MQICGRTFTPQDIDWIRSRVKTLPDLTRIELSRIFCRHAGWYKPDGGLKDMSCRVAMLRLERAGIIELPAPRKKNAPVRIGRTPDGEPKPLLDIDPGTPLDIRPVTSRTTMDPEGWTA
jgi:hypothetical protein